jgi:mannose-6-phosphate isomerase-like protein (cupin superfamily)
MADEVKREASPAAASGAAADARTFRRVVTARTPDGRSRVLLDAPARAFGTLHEHWSTDHQEPSTVRGEVADATERLLNIAPDGSGSVFRFVEIEPESRFAGMTIDEQREITRRAFASIASDDVLVDTHRHPAMHQTNTIDYIVLLSGTLTMLLDDGEVELRPFDVVVQRGTNHAWVNRGEERALLAAILISAG